MSMTKTLTVMALAGILSIAAPAAHAEDAPAADAPAAAAMAPADNGKAGKSEENFAERKAKVLERIGKREACVEAATTPEAMKACFPNRGKWKQHKEKSHEQKEEAPAKTE
jgi:hypothetical protein